MAGMAKETCGDTASASIHFPSLFITAVVFAGAAATAATLRRTRPLVFETVGDSRRSIGKQFHHSFIYSFIHRGCENSNSGGSQLTEPLEERMVIATKCELYQYWRDVLPILLDDINLGLRRDRL
jgi:hypothetical protein